MRGMAVALIVMMVGAALLAGLAAADRRVMFDPALLRGDYRCSWDASQKPGPVSEDIEGWFSLPLRRVNEPSLYRQAQAEPFRETLRLTFSPAFAEPVVVRLDDLHGAHPRLTATRYEGQVVSTADNRIVRDLSDDEARGLRSLVMSTGVLSLSPDSCLSGMHGVIYIIEAAGPDGYRFINRWGIAEGPVYEVANAMYRLTGWPNGEEGPDRHAAWAAM